LIGVCMFETVLINRENVRLISLFLKNAGNSLNSFRYYNNRELSVIANHLYTVMFLDDGHPICYGHLDQDDGKVWLGIAVIQSNVGKKLGTQMMGLLIDEAKKKQLKTIWLSVDADNLIAIELYEKFDFTLAQTKLEKLFYRLSLEV